MVNMVNNFFRRRVHNYPVHKGFFPFYLGTGIGAVCSFVCGPFEGVEPVIIGGIDDSDFAFGKRNKPDLVIFRLDNGRTVDNRLCPVVSAGSAKVGREKPAFCAISISANKKRIFFGESLDKVNTGFAVFCAQVSSAVVGMTESSPQAARLNEKMDSASSAE